MKKHALLFGLLLIGLYTFSQPYFRLTYPGNYFTGMNYVADETKDKLSYYSIGWQIQLGAHTGAHLFRTDKSGNVIMRRSYRAAGVTQAFTYAYDGQETSDSGYVLMGYDGGGFVASRNTLFVIKTITTGALQWAKTYDIPGGTFVDGGGTGLPLVTPSIQQTKDGGYVFSAVYRVAGVRYAYVFKTDALGVLQWSNRVSGFEFGGKVRQTSLGEYILCGNTIMGGQKDILLVKLDASGTIQWSRRHGSVSKDEYPHSIIETNAGGFAFCGDACSVNGAPRSGQSDMFVYVVSNSGQALWDKVMGNASVCEYAQDITQDPNGDFVLSGVAQGIGDTYIGKINQTGAVQWERRLGDAGNEQLGFSINKVTNGYLLATGRDAFIPQPGMIATNPVGLIGCDTVTVTLPQTSGIVSAIITVTSSNQTNAISVLAQTPVVYNSGAAEAIQCMTCILAVSSDTSICSGNSATLTAGTGSTSYIWNSSDPNVNGIFGQTVVVTPTTTTTYTVTEQDCGLQSVITVSVIPLPVISISPAITLCVGDSVKLTASGATTYSWSPFSGISSSTGSSVVITGTIPLTYTIYASSSGCNDTATVTITPNPLPILSVSTNTIICAGGQTLLTAGGASTYTWSNSATGPSIISSPNTTTTYTVTGVDGNGCKNTAVTTVSVSPMPTALISGPSVICAGGGVTLSASGGGAYLWSNLAISNTISVNPLVTTTYSVLASLGICSHMATHQLIVNPLPTVFPSASDSSICIGAPTSLSAYGTATNYLWQPLNSLGNSVTVSPTSNTTYSVIGTDGNLCSSSSILTITVNSLPVILTSPPIAICDGESTTLTASGGNNYSWSNGPSASSITVSPTSNTIYTVSGIDLNGCSNTSFITVSVNPTPIAIINGGPPICVGSSAGLTASGGGNYIWDNLSTNSTININPINTCVYSVTVSLGTCNDTASWVVTVNPLPVIQTSSDTSICLGNSVILSVSGSSANYLWSPVISSSATLNVSPITTTNYSVTATDVNGCKNNAVVTVRVNSLPVISVSTNTTICAGSTTVLSASGGVNYLWNNLSSSSSINVAPLTNTMYSVTVKNSNGCTATASVLVSVDQPPVPSVSNDTSVCEGQPIVLLASGGTSYSWSTGSLSPAIEISTHAGLIKYVVSVFKGVCEIKESIFVNVFSLPVVNAGSNVTITKGSSIQLNATGGIGYSWSPPTGLSCVNCPDPIASPTETTTYYVTVTNEIGCTATDLVIVNVEWICADLFIPNVFSPNGDGQNDLFHVYGDCVKEVFISIYNQWGERVFEDTGASPYWDGTFRGQELNSDIFAYNAKIILVSGEEISKVGNVTLLK